MNWLALAAALVAAGGPPSVKLSDLPYEPDMTTPARPGDLVIVLRFAADDSPLPALAARTEPAYDEFSRVWQAKDQARIDAMQRDGRVYWVDACATGELVSLRDYDPGDPRPRRAEIRLNGRTAWVPASAVHRPRPNPNYKPAPGEDRASRDYLIASKLEAAGKTEAALKSYRRVVRDHPGTLGARFAAARLAAQ